MVGHTQSVRQVKFDPHTTTHLASSSYDFSVRYSPYLFILSLFTVNIVDYGMLIIRYILYCKLSIIILSLLILLISVCIREDLWVKHMCTHSLPSPPSSSSLSPSLSLLPSLPPSLLLFSPLPSSPPIHPILLISCLFPWLRNVLTIFIYWLCGWVCVCVCGCFLGVSWWCNYSLLLTKLMVILVIMLHSTNRLYVGKKISSFPFFFSCTKSLKLPSDCWLLMG